jgi:hypothetical protein
MTGQSRPWMKFYPSDWRADPKLRSCEPLSRYVWLEMIGLMHEAEPYGHLMFAGKAMPPAKLARLIGMDLAEVDSAIDDLELNAVLSRREDGVIFSRRMIRDEAKHQKASNFGKKGVKAKALKDKEETPPLEGKPKGALEGSHEASLEPPHEGTHQPRDQSPDRPPVSPPRGGRSDKSSLPEDWEPEEFSEGTQCRAIVDSWTRLQFEHQLEAFAAHHRREGSRFASWQDGWKTWVLNSRRFAERDAQRDEKRSGHGSKDFADIVLEEAAAESGGGRSRQSDEEK